MKNERTAAHGTAAQQRRWDSTEFKAFEAITYLDDEIVRRWVDTDGAVTPETLETFGLPVTARQRAAV